MHRVIFKIGNFEIYTYGVMLVLGFLAGFVFAIRRNKNKIVSNDTMMDFSLFVLLGGVLGARLAYVLLHLKDYISHPISILNLREGGLAWHGGLIGGFITAFLFCRKKKIDLYELMDLYAPSTIVGLAIGRIGCFMNGCCIGTETNSPWGLVFRDAGYTTPRHPTQIYELLLDLIVVFLLVSWEKRKRFSGEIFLLMFSLYSIVRFIVEFFRFSPPRVLGLSLAQYSSIIIFIVTLVWIYMGRKKVPGKGGLIKLGKR